MFETELAKRLLRGSPETAKCVIRSVNTICFEGSKGRDLSGFRACLVSTWGPLGALFAQSGASESLKREVENKSKFDAKADLGQSGVIEELGCEPLKEKISKKLRTYQRSPRYPRD